MTSLYAYGVIADEDLDITLDDPGVEGATRLQTVSYGHIATVVSEVSTTDPDRTDEAVQAHDETIRTVMQHGEGRTVVPMQFGMAFENERTLKNVLRGAAPAFRRALKQVEGTVELGVKVVSESDFEASEDRIEAVESAVAENLEPIAVEASEGDRFSDRLLYNGSFLVDRERRTAFDEAVERLEDSCEGTLVRYSGPFAPYNFVDVSVGAER